jgi:hypothetical protein
MLSFEEAGLCGCIDILMMREKIPKALFEAMLSFIFF